jgi:di/tricarboxylate transporter
MMTYSQPSTHFAPSALRSRFSQLPILHLAGELKYYPRRIVQYLVEVQRRSKRLMTWCRKKRALLWIILLLNLAASISSDAQSRSVTTRGKDVVSPNGKTLLLKGINLGNWLLPEGYMFKFKTANSPRLINTVINQLVGEEEGRRFLEDVS